MSFVWVSWHKEEKVSKGTIELMRNLHLKKAFYSTLPLRGTHVKTRIILCSVQGLCSSIILNWISAESLEISYGSHGLVWKSNPCQGLPRNTTLQPLPSSELSQATICHQPNSCNSSRLTLTWRCPLRQLYSSLNSKCSSVWSLRITTASGKCLNMYLIPWLYILRITNCVSVPHVYICQLPSL